MTDPVPFVERWSLTAPAITGRMEAGLNSESWLVRAAEGEFVLRMYSNLRGPDHLAALNELVVLLAVAELSFAVPVPLPLPHGASFTVGPAGSLATLTPLLPGRSPRPEEIELIELAGSALAELDAALATLRPERSLPAFEGDLRSVHPLVDDPADTIAELDLGPRRAEVLAEVERAAEGAPLLYASLPRQLVHGDFALPNVLVSDARVTALLDFEDAGADVRVMDLAGAIYIVSVRGDPAEAELRREAVGRGYAARLPLDPLEVAALPDVLRLRAVVGALHWCGRARAGLASEEDAAVRARRIVDLAPDLYGPSLATAAARWSGL